MYLTHQAQASHLRAWDKLPMHSPRYTASQGFGTQHHMLTHTSSGAAQQSLPRPRLLTASKFSEA